MIACLLLSGVASAKPEFSGTGAFAARFSIDPFDPDDGLPQRSVVTIAQDHDGYLLVGTFGGLARFDGVRFNVFDSQLPDIRFTALHVAEDDSVYVGTQYGTVARVEGDRLVSLPGPGTPAIGVIRAMATTADGLWVASECCLLRFEGDRWQRYSEMGPMNGLAVARDTLYGVGRDGLWAITRDGFSRLDESSDINGIEATEEHLWFTSSVEVAAWSLDEKRKIPLWTFDNKLEMPSLALGPDGWLWLGGRGELLLLGQTSELLAAAHNGRRQVPAARWVIPDRIHDLFVDRESNLWLGESTHGLMKVASLPFARHSLDSGLSSASVLAIDTSQMPPLVAPFCDGLFAFDGGRFHAQSLPGDEHCVFSMLRRRSGELWLGQDEGISVLGSSGLVLPFERHVLSMAETGDALWIGTDGMGAFTWRANVLAPVDVLDEGTVPIITVGPDGAVWMGSAGGIAVSRAGVTRWFGQDDGFAPSQVRAILVDDDGIGAWIGTYGSGLLRFDGKKVVLRISRDEGLPDNVVSSILAPDGRGLWMNGNRGVWHIEREQLDAMLRAESSAVSAILFASGEGNGGVSPSSGIDPLGRLWFATIDGAVVFNPSDIRHNDVAPIPIIESIEIDGALCEGIADCQAPPGVRDMTVRFTAAVLTHPQLARFQYRLWPLEEEWREAGSQRFVRYTHTPHGKYRFEIRAANEDGVWSVAPAAAKIVLEPRLYERRDVQFGGVVSAAAGVWLSFQLLNRAQRRRARSMQEEIDLRKRIEEQLRVSEAHYRSLFELASDGLLLTDLDGVVTAANAAAAKLFGCLPGELVGRRRQELVRPGEGGQSGVHVDGSEFPAQVAIVPLDASRVLVSVVDVGALVALQERSAEAQRIAAMGRLAGGVAHDFNNLLTVVRGNATALAGDIRVKHPGEMGWLEALDHIETVTRRGSDLTRQLLAFGQQQTLRPEAFDMVALVQRMKPILERLVSAGVHITFETGPPSVVYADPHQFELVLVNLVLNAIDAISARGEIRITVTEMDDAHARTLFPDLPVPGPMTGRWVDLSVADTGAGITHDVLPHLFEAFFSTKDGPGRGLGLASVHGYVKQSSGAVFVSSVVGEGTRFEVVLPTTHHSLSATPEQSVSVSTVSVLLCDDDPLVLRTVERVLRSGGYTVRTASSPAAALAALSTSAFDLLVTDVLMPEMTGIELVRRARKLIPALRVVYISGYTREALPKEMADPLVPKPFEPAALLAVVRSVLRHNV